MNSNLSRLLRAGVLAGGLIAVGAGVAHADETTSGQHGLLSGNQVVVPITVPITVDGNAIALLGHAVAHRSSAASTPASPIAVSHPATRHIVHTSGRHAIASGNQVIVPVVLPIRVADNAVAVLGRAHSDRALSEADPGTPAGSTGASSPAPMTTGDGSVGSGNQVVAPVTVPVTVGGTAVGVLGSATSGSSTGGGSTGGGSTGGGSTGGGSTGGGSTGGGSTGTAVLGERIRADRVGSGDSSSNAVIAGDALPFTGGVPLPLLVGGALFVLTGLLLRRAGRTGHAVALSRPQADNWPIVGADSALAR